MITGKDARSVVYKQVAACRDSPNAVVLSTKAKNLIKTHSTKEFADFISQLDDPDHKIIHTASHALQLLQNVKWCDCMSTYISGVFFYKNKMEDMLPIFKIRMATGLKWFLELLNLNTASRINYTLINVELS